MDLYFKNKYRNPYSLSHELYKDYLPNHFVT